MKETELTLPLLPTELSTPTMRSRDHYTACANTTETVLFSWDRHRKFGRKRD